MVSDEDIESYESDLELELYREYRDVISLFNHVVGTDRRFYLANKVNVATHSNTGENVFFGIELRDAWVWDVYRSSRSVQGVKVLSPKDVNIEELSKPKIEIPSQLTGAPLLAGQVGVGGDVGGVGGIVVVFQGG